MHQQLLKIILLPSTIYLFTYYLFRCGSTVYLNSLSSGKCIQGSSEAHLFQELKGNRPLASHHLVVVIWVNDGLASFGGNFSTRFLAVTNEKNVVFLLAHITHIKWFPHMRKIKQMPGDQTREKISFLAITLERENQ